jgi:Holliday junction resolvase
MKIPDWKKFEEYLVGKLLCIDKYAKRTPGSGNKGIKGDVDNKYLLIEAKYTDKKSISLKRDIWKKLLSELPLHSSRIPMYALKDGEGNKWAVLDLDDFLDMFIELTKYREDF